MRGPLVTCLVAMRVGNFTRLVGRYDIIGRTGSGFSQSCLNPWVHPTILWAKLQALRAGCWVGPKGSIND